MNMPLAKMWSIHQGYFKSNKKNLTRVNAATSDKILNIYTTQPPYPQSGN